MTLRVRSLSFARPLDLSLPRRTLLVGENGAGKSTTLSAVALALAGHDPALGKTPGAVAERTPGGIAEVDLFFGDDLVAQGRAAAGARAAKPEAGWAVATLALGVEAVEGRRAILRRLVDAARDESAVEAIQDRLAEIKVVLRSAPGEALLDYVDRAREKVGEIATSARAAKTRAAKVREDAAAKAPATKPDLDLLAGRVAQAREALESAGGRAASDRARLETELRAATLAETRAKEAAEEARARSASAVVPEDDADEAKILAPLEEARVAAVEEAEVASIEAEDADGAKKVAADRLRALRDAIAKLEVGAECPTCRRVVDSVDALRVAEEELAKTLATASTVAAGAAEARRAAIEKLDAATKAVSSARAALSDRSRARAAALSTKDALSARAADATSRAFEAKAAREALAARLASLPSGDPEAVASARSALDEATRALAAANGDAEKFATLVRAEKALDEAEAERKRVEEVVAALERERARVLSSSAGPALDALFPYAEALGGAPWIESDGADVRIGVVRGAQEIEVAALSAGERAVLLAGLAAAALVRSPEPPDRRVLLVDADPVRGDLLAKLLAALDAEEIGTIVVAVPGRSFSPDVSLAPGSSSFEIVDLGSKLAIAEGEGR